MSNASDETRWHWAAPKGNSDLEPACVNYRNGQPYEVWFAGMDTEFSADQCEIADEIPPLARKE